MDDRRVCGSGGRWEVVVPEAEGFPDKAPLELEDVDEIVDLGILDP
jgi:hypothetical protein